MTVLLVEGGREDDVCEAAQHQRYASGKMCRGKSPAHRSEGVERCHMEQPEEPWLQLFACR